ncbi:MAG: hypothetical protein V1855_00780 [bacterium]
MKKVKIVSLVLLSLLFGNVSYMQNYTCKVSVGASTCKVTIKKTFDASNVTCCRYVDNGNAKRAVVHFNLNEIIVSFLKARKRIKDKEDRLDEKIRNSKHVRDRYKYLCAYEQMLKDLLEPAEILSKLFSEKSQSQFYLLESVKSREQKCTKYFGSLKEIKIQENSSFSKVAFQQEYELLTKQRLGNFCESYNDKLDKVKKKLDELEEKHILNHCGGYYEEDELENFGTES